MKFFITFGQKYRHEAHPLGGHPDGWFEVEAQTQGEAREKAYGAMGAAWSFIYAETVFTPELYPLGKMGDIDKPFTRDAGYSMLDVLCFFAVMGLIVMGLLTFSVFARQVFQNLQSVERCIQALLECVTI